MFEIHVQTHGHPNLPASQSALFLGSLVLLSVVLALPVSTLDRGSPQEEGSVC